VINGYRHGLSARATDPSQDNKALKPLIAFIQGYIAALNQVSDGLDPILKSPVRPTEVDDVLSGIDDACRRNPKVNGPASGEMRLKADTALHLLPVMQAIQELRHYNVRRSAPVGRLAPGWQVGKIVFVLSRRAVFADEPGLIPREMLLTLVPYPLRGSVGCAHANSGKAGFQPALRPVSPAHILPLGIGQHVFGRDR
jgi:hypothetical protein